MISMEPHEVTAHDALFITNTTSPYYQYPYSLSRLPAVYEKGLYGPGICGLLSAISCLICLVLIASKLIEWKKGMTDFFTYVGIVSVSIRTLLTRTESIPDPPGQSALRRDDPRSSICHITLLDPRTSYSCSYSYLLCTRTTS